MVGKLKEHHYQGLDGKKENDWIEENAETVPGTPAVFKDCPYLGRPIEASRLVGGPQRRALRAARRVGGFRFLRIGLVKVLWPLSF
jgi:hypothetical protein